jgi:sugar phosphate permease
VYYGCDELVPALHSDHTRGCATALHQSGNFTEIAAGGVPGGWFAVHWGWRSSFFFLGALGTLYALPLRGALRRIVASLPEAGPRGPSVPRLAGAPVRPPGYPSMLAVFGLCSAAGWLVLTWIPLYLHERFPMDLVQAGFTATFRFNLGAFSGLFMGGWLSDWLSVRSPTIRAHLPA